MVGDLTGCAEKLAAAQAASHVGLDPQGDERLVLLRAHLACRSGKASEVARFYGLLTNSATDSLRAEATAMLISKRITE